VTEVSVTVRSTTGTQPLTFTRINASLVQIEDEHGATQIYRVAEILNAVKDQEKK
jgi:hypothetical protein